jgi:hypothetical protein
MSPTLKATAGKTDGPLQRHASIPRVPMAISIIIGGCAVVVWCLLAAISANSPFLARIIERVFYVPEEFPEE